MKKILSTFIVMFVLWIALSGFEVSELITGAVVSILLALVISKFVSYNLGISTIGKGVKFILLYIPLFIWKLILSNLQMAKIVLSPKLPIHPGFVVIKTDLQSETGKLALANSITLTPGTLSIDIKEDELLIHWVDVEGESQEEHKNIISKSFEKSLGGVFG